MSPFIPLLFTLVLINYRKLQNNKNYRFSVFSIVGITFFFILNFANYYFAVSSYSELTQNITNGIIIISTALLCLSPIIVKSGLVCSSISITFFALSILLTLGFDREIKNFIVGESDYFDKKIIKKGSKPTGETKKYVSLEGGYHLQLPTAWTPKKHKSDLDYFILTNDDKLVAELRPRCFHETGNVITDVVDSFKKNDLTENKKTNKECYKAQGAYICLVKSIYTKPNIPIERWHWLAMNPKSQQNIELDILIYQKTPQIDKALYSIINTVEIGQLPNPTPMCGNTLEWF